MDFPEHLLSPQEKVDWSHRDGTEDIVRKIQLTDIKMSKLPAERPPPSSFCSRETVKKWDSEVQNRSSLRRKKESLQDQLKRIESMKTGYMAIKTELNRFLPDFLGLKGNHLGIYIPSSPLSKQERFHLTRASSSKMMKQKFKLDTVWILRNKKNAVLATVDEITGQVLVRPENSYVAERLVQLGIEKHEAIRSWARDHDVCMMCNAALTDDASRREGMGPDCQKHFVQRMTCPLIYR